MLLDKVSDVRVIRGFDRRLFGVYDWKVPRNILPKLKHFHSDPFGWWTGQFVKYLFRLQPWVVEKLKEREKTVPLTSSTMG